MESVVLSERVNRLVWSEVGVWVSFRSSSLLMLYHAHHALPLLSMDYCTLLPALQADSEKVLPRFQFPHHTLSSTSFHCIGHTIMTMSYRTYQTKLSLGHDLTLDSIPQDISFLILSYRTCPSLTTVSPV